MLNSSLVMTNPEKGTKFVYLFRETKNMMNNNVDRKDTASWPSSVSTGTLQLNH